MAYRPQTQTGPLISRSAFIGLVVAGIVGGVVGLILGLRANPATAWFAVFEVGVPASILGALVGFGCGVTLWAFRRGTRASK